MIDLVVDFKDGVLEHILKLFGIVLITMILMWWADTNRRYND